MVTNNLKGKWIIQKMVLSTNTEDTPRLSVSSQ